MRNMTRMEAIIWLKIIRANIKLFPGISASKKIRALDYAIDALEINQMYSWEYERLERKNEQIIGSKLGTDKRKGQEEQG